MDSLEKSLAAFNALPRTGALLIATCAFVLCLLAAAPQKAHAWCVYANPEYSRYNRLLRVEVIRFGENVGEIRYSQQFDGYYVRCKKGGLPKKNFFARARDARWAACDSCY